MPIISKSSFLQFQQCPKDTWLKLHRPELAETFAPTAFELHLMQQGNEVEAIARRLWPKGVVVTETGDEAVAATAALIAARVPAIFQATFLVDGFLIKCDVLVPGKEANGWDLFEIKGTNAKKEEGEDHDHISDLAFQVNVLAKAGLVAERCFVVHLNKTYVRGAKLDIRALFTTEDVSEEVRAIRSQIAEEMAVAKAYLGREEEPDGGCDCHYRARSRHCRTFAYSHPYVPGYSVHDITRIGASKKKLQQLVDRGIYKVEDVPQDFALSDVQANQVQTHRSGRPLIDPAGIEAALAAFKYPLYFFDYETFAPAVPAYDGFSPYQRIPFQFSLHVLKAPEGELEHIEFLHEEHTDPTAAAAERLASTIDPNGSVVVWYAPFERGVNAEIGKRAPGYAPAMARINSQIVDLRDVFVAQHYVHPGFQGSTSIKAVLPVLVPELSYESLGIKEGGAASEAWWRMVASRLGQRERQEIAAALKAYCRLDTYAMYAIWRELRQEI